MNKFLIRTFQLITGVNKVHHIYYSYGYKIPFLKVGYFPTHSWKKMKGHGIDYHNCTVTGIY